MALPVALTAVAAVPAVASAGTVSVSGSQVTYAAAAGETNKMAANAFFDTDDSMMYVLRISDSAPITIAAGSPCAIDSFGGARCTLATPGSFNLQLGDANDTSVLSNTDGTTNAVDAGPGDDKVSVTVLNGRNTIAGGDGDDALNPDVGDGGRPVNPPASDVISGGPGVDTVNYSEDYGGHVSAITLNLDGLANDGGPGEQDNVQPDVEKLLGTSEVDTFVGGPGPNEFFGFGDNDVLAGGGGNDRLLGGGENDQLSGGDGDDFLEGGPDDDRLDGGAGLDSFIGDFSGGDNQIVFGNDSIFARDGVQGEPISCGPGSDKATVDFADNVNADPQNLCEMVDRAAVPRPRGCKVVKKGAKRDRCVYKAALKKCGKVKPRKRRVKCVKSAKRTYALKKCTRVKKSKRATCVRKAKRAFR